MDTTHWVIFVSMVLVFLYLSIWGLVYPSTPISMYKEVSRVKSNQKVRARLEKCLSLEYINVSIGDKPNV